MPAPNKDLFTTKRELAFDDASCTGCAMCISACPAHALDMSAQHTAFLAEPARCTFCLICAHRCRNHAITAITVEIEGMFDYAKPDSICAPGQPGAHPVFEF